MAFMKTGAPVTAEVVSFKPEIPETVVDKARFLQGMLDALSLSKKPQMGETDYWAGWDAGNHRLNSEGLEAQDRRTRPDPSIT